MKRKSSATTAETVELACPQCGGALPADAMTCPSCSVDLALVALLAERAYLAGRPGAAPITAPPEALVPRIGEYLIEQGLLTPEQLDLALERQRELREQDESRLTGEILVDMGFVDREVLDGVINRQIIALHAALQEANRNLEQRVAERTKELEQALASLTELNQLKANLISNVSHELRTPLAHIKGYMELLASKQLGSLEEGQVSALDVIQRATQRLESLIEDLIEFSTSSREGISLRLQAFDVDELLNTVHQHAHDRAKRGKIELAIETEKSLPRVRGDMERLGWALNQLVDNAIKFTPEGGRVSLKAARHEDWVILSVEDTGIGIPPDRIDEIFLPFHQLDGSIQRRYGGTGLGLALVNLILEAHDTKVTVTSEEGQGSTFSFTLSEDSPLS
jgi:signal transduction histidine kinase